MGDLLAIRREDKSASERRVPLTPAMVQRLVEQQGLDVLIQPSPQRVFLDAEFTGAGATVTEDISAAPVIFGVKEVPTAALTRGTAYMYFSHVIKGQSYNMAMLSRLLELECTLIDYERVIDDEGKRLIFFGRFAGLAGMIDGLFTLGQRLKWEGIQTPLSSIGQSLTYNSLADAKQAVRDAGERVAAEGLPSACAPLIIGVVGSGNVGRGAQEILEELPLRDITPAQVAEIASGAGASNRVIYRVTFNEEDFVEPIAPQAAFTLNEYYEHPERYRSCFAQYLDHLSIIMSCVYWDSRYPRLVTFEDIERLYAGGVQPRLRVLGDISCDIEGTLQSTIKVTDPDDPVYVFDPVTHTATSGVAGHGPVVLAVDILPTELPRESSEEFSRVLEQFVPAIAAADYQVPFAELALPSAIKRAVIVHRGQLTPDYAYLEEFLT
jgi:alanine dehydrogenase